MRNGCASYSLHVSAAVLSYKWLVVMLYKSLKMTLHFRKFFHYSTVNKTLKGLYKLYRLQIIYNCLYIQPFKFSKKWSRGFLPPSDCSDGTYCHNSSACLTYLPGDQMLNNDQKGHLCRSFWHVENNNSTIHIQSRNFSIYMGDCIECIRTRLYKTRMHSVDVEFVYILMFANTTH